MNIRYYIIAILLIFVTFGLNGVSDIKEYNPEDDFWGYTTQVSQSTQPIKIRLLALKHSRESMADGDAMLAINAAKKAAASGLAIKDIGNQYIDKNGQVQFVIWEYGSDLPKLKEFVSQRMKIDAEPGDTVIVFTIGHGHEGGTLQNLGQRSDVMKALAEAAEENNQRTLWWQLSCHASAGLPKISSLTPKQQELFSVLASSTVSEISAAGVQGRIMEKVFMAIASKDKSIDPNGDGVVTAGELKDFINSAVGSRRGDLLSACKPDSPIFGGVQDDLVRLIPIVDRNEPQKKYPKDYIPMPEGK